MIDLKLLYPELIAYDGLPSTLQSRLATSVPNFEIQSGIRFSKLQEMSEPFEEQGLYHMPCTGRGGIGRSVSVDIAIEQHLYLLTLASKANDAKVFLEVDNLEKVLAFLNAWLRGNMDIERLKQIESFVMFLNLEDDLQYIHWQWMYRYHNAVNYPALTGPIAPLFAQALQDPVLRQVTPFTSLMTLRLSRCTEYPFLTSGYPVAHPIYAISPHKKYIVQRRILDQAERLIQIPPELGMVTRYDMGNYEFIDRYGERLCKGDPFTILEFIIDYSLGRYIVGDAQGKGLETRHAKEAVAFLRNALPINGYPSLRGSADDLNSEKLSIT